MFKKRLLSTLISLTFSISIVSGLGINSFMVSAFTEQREIISNVVYPINTIDEFIPSTSIVDESFEDNRVVVWIKHQYSEFNKVWSADYFGIENILHVKDATPTEWDDKTIQDYLNQPSVIFRQAVYIYLENPGKENVLKMIQDIESRNLNEIQCINTSYYLDLDDDTFELYSINDSPSLNPDSHKAINLFESWKYTKGNSNVIAGVLEGGRPAEYDGLPLVDVFDINSPISHHTTAVSGTLCGKDYGVAPNISLAALSPNKPYTHIDVFNYARENGIKVVNQSSGGYYIPLENSNLVNAVAAYKGLYICSAGNGYSVVSTDDNGNPEEDTTIYYKDEFGTPADNRTRYKLKTAYNVDGVFKVAQTETLYISDGNGGYVKKNGVYMKEIDAQRIPQSQYYDHSNIITVAACTSGGKNLLNWGKTIVDIAAPLDNQKVWNFITDSTGNPIFDANGNFQFSEQGSGGGTSNAAPVVSGVAALIWSYNPSLTNLEVKEAILESAKKYDDFYNDYIVSTDPNKKFTFDLTDKVASEGMVNAYEALKYVSNPVTVSLNQIGTAITDITFNITATNEESEINYILGYEDLDNQADGNTVFYIPNLKGESTYNVEINANGELLQSFNLNNHSLKFEDSKILDEYVDPINFIIETANANNIDIVLYNGDRYTTQLNINDNTNEGTFCLIESGNIITRYDQSEIIDLYQNSIIKFFSHENELITELSANDHDEMGAINNTVAYYLSSRLKMDNTLEINFTNYKFGDVNLDNDLNIDDSLMLAIYLVGGYSFIQTGSIDNLQLGNGNITINGDISSNGSFILNANNANINGILSAATFSSNVNTLNMNHPINDITITNELIQMIFTDEQMGRLFYSNSEINIIQSDIEDELVNYVVEENNINISIPTIVKGDISFLGNTNINSNIKAFGNIHINGNVQNTCNSVIYSQFGDITFDSTNINYSGLIYAPNGTVTISGDNITITGTILAKELIIEGNNVNFNVAAINTLPNYTEELTLTAFQLFIGDVNHDGKINIFDIIIINRMIVSEV